MSTYSPESQINFVIQWFKSWSEFQKDDFVTILGQKLNVAGAGDTPAINGLVNGIRGLDASGRPPSLFTCQVKLFGEWWDNWSAEDRQKMSDLFKEADPQFWKTLEAELEGTRQTLNEDFMIVTASSETLENPVSNGSSTKGGVSPVPPVFNVKQILLEDSSVKSHNASHEDDSNRDEVPSGTTDVEEPQEISNGDSPVATAI